MDFLIWKRESWSLNGFSELSLIAMYLLRHLLEAQFFPRLFMRRNVRWKSYIPYTFLTWWVFVFCLRTSVRVPDLNNWKKKKLIILRFSLYVRTHTKDKRSRKITEFSRQIYCNWTWYVRLACMISWIIWSNVEKSSLSHSTYFKISSTPI